MTDPTIVSHVDATKDVELAPKHKLAHDRYNVELAEKAQIRQAHCWMRDATGCKGAPIVHVQEVGFDLRAPDSSVKVAMISSKDMTGPVPGFCAGCLASAPPMLAEAIYVTRPEMRFGFKPTRWFIRFTDGSGRAGSCSSIALNRADFFYTDRATS